MVAFSTARGTGSASCLPWRTWDRSGRAVTIRPLVANDAVEYLRHTARIVKETPYMLQCEYDPLPPVEAQRRLIEQIARSANSQSLIAFRPGATQNLRIVGSITLLGGRSQRTRHVCSLGMGVDRAEWGQGIGGMLLDAALHWGRSHAFVVRIGLQVFTDNESAIHLYRSRGFVVEGTMERDVMLGDSYGTLEGMSLDVSAAGKTAT